VNSKKCVQQRVVRTSKDQFPFSFFRRKVAGLGVQSAPAGALSDCWHEEVKQWAQAAWWAGAVCHGIAGSAKLA
jgi:hypothetical protein